MFYSVRSSLSSVNYVGYQKIRRDLEVRCPVRYSDLRVLLRLTSVSGGVPPVFLEF